MATMTSPRLTEKQAKGVQNGKLMKLVCAFDIETWETIRAHAAKAGTSVAEQVLRMVEIGLEETE